MQHFFSLPGDCATPDVLMGSAASVLEIYYGSGGLRKASMTDFGKFAGELAEELGKRDSAQASTDGVPPNEHAHKRTPLVGSEVFQEPDFVDFAHNDGAASGAAAAIKRE